MHFWIKARAWLAILSATLVISTMLLILRAYISIDLNQEQQLKAGIMLTTVDQMAIESRNVITHLNNITGNDCTEQMLIEMRRALFKSNFIKDIGFLEGNRLVCTTALGKLQRPAATSTPDFIGREGFEIWTDEELLLFDMQYSAAIVRKGRFNVVLDRTDLPLHQLKPFDFELVFSHNGRQEHIAGKPQIFKAKASGSAGVFALDTYFSLCSTSQPYCIALQIDQIPLTQKYAATLYLTVTLSLMLGLATYHRVLGYLEKRSSIEERIRRGLVNNNFYWLYQPIVDLKSRRIIGCEVLARHQDNYGQVFPDQFIPLIRQFGITWAFTEKMIQTALLELDQAEALPDDFRISMNIFPQDIVSDTIKGITLIPEVRKSRFQLALEITEDEYLDKSSAQSNLSRLKLQGFQLVIDDFGTGYSNLKQLRRIDCDTLKIDRSFVMEMEDETIRSSLIPHVVEIAKDLGLNIVAEGIENENQRNALLKLGVQYGQGWAFGKPMTAGEFTALYTAQKESQTLLDCGSEPTGDCPEPLTAYR